jgi:signal peptidase I
MESHASRDSLRRTASWAVARAVASLGAAVEICVPALVFALFARTFVAQAFVIPSGSMEPGMLSGDRVLVNKYIFGVGAGLPERERWSPSRAPQRGDVIVFRHPQAAETLVKRCVGLPGDRVELVGKRLHVNGLLVEEARWTRHRDPQVYDRGLGLDPRIVARDNFGPYLVPAGEYFVLGDNRDDSDDSRFWGSVPSSSMKGRVAVVYWSVEPSVSSVWPRWGRLFRAVR